VRQLTVSAFFTIKSYELFSRRQMITFFTHLTTPTLSTFPLDHWFSVFFCKFTRKNIYTFIRVLPLDNVTRGVTPFPLRPS